MLRLLLISVIFAVEGLGVVLNALLLVKVWTLRNDRIFKSYRVCLSVIAFHGLLYAAATMITIPIPRYTSSFFLKVFCGPIVLLPPSRRVEIAALFIQSAAGRATWLLFPSTFVFQYLTLCRPAISSVARMMIIYGVTMALGVVSMRSIFYLIPKESDVPTMEKGARDYFDEPADSNYRIIVFGTMYDSSKQDYKMFFIFLIPILLGIGLVKFCVWRINAQLKQHRKECAVDDIALKRERSVTKALMRQAFVLLIIAAPGVLIPARVLFSHSHPSSSFFVDTILPATNSFLLYCSPLASASIFLLHLPRSASKTSIRSNLSLKL